MLELQCLTWFLTHKLMEMQIRAGESAFVDKEDGARAVLGGPQPCIGRVERMSCHVRQVTEAD